MPNALKKARAIVRPTIRSFLDWGFTRVFPKKKRRGGAVGEHAEHVCTGRYIPAAVVTARGTAVAFYHCRSNTAAIYAEFSL